ncbi:hypothetical protein F4775DRAFT_578486 [Biscogniauxia sp. FL1348]|nr:hypothetical protein F4775DRAFT_578486 [Biscogniauxia sp. FL1348]
MRSGFVWYCCQCGDGPMRVTANDYCIICSKSRCAGCTIETALYRDQSSQGTTPASSTDDIPGAVRSDTQQVDDTVTASQGPTISPVKDKPSETPELAPECSNSNDNNASKNTTIGGNQVGPGRTRLRDKLWTNNVSYLSHWVQRMYSVFKGEVHEQNIITDNVKLDEDIRGKTTAIGDTASDGCVVDSKSTSTSSPATQIDLPFAVQCWLQSKKDDPYHALIVDLWDELWSDEPVDGSDTRPISTQHSTNNTGRQPQPESSRKRKARGTNDESSNGRLKRSTSAKTPSTSYGQGPPFACHLGKLNPLWYPKCAQSGIKRMCHLANHVRKHGNDPFLCEICGLPFSEESLLELHTRQGSCRQIVGTDIRTIGLPGTHNMSDVDKWFWMWDQLFPGRPRPQSPYREPLENLPPYSPEALRRRLEVLDIPSGYIDTFLDELRAIQEQYTMPSPGGRASMEFSTPAQPMQSDGDRQGSENDLSSLQLGPVDSLGSLQETDGRMDQGTRPGGASRSLPVADSHAGIGPSAADSEAAEYIQDHGIGPVSSTAQWSSTFELIEHPDQQMNLPMDGNLVSDDFLQDLRIPDDYNLDLYYNGNLEHELTTTS